MNINENIAIFVKHVPQVHRTLQCIRTIADGLDMLWSYAEMEHFICQKIVDVI